MVIIGILSVISFGAFTSARSKARDSERKSNLDAVSKSLMMYFNDNGKFPETLNLTTENVAFTGANDLVYMAELPVDPKNLSPYIYVYKVTSDFKKFNLYANLENKLDSQCQDTPYSVDGVEFCYGLTSPNTTVNPNQF